MKRVTASAPGKVILFGEHAVVYGQPAIAVPVSDLRTTAVATPSETSGLHITAPDLGESITITDLAAIDVGNPLAFTAKLLLEQLASPTPNVSIHVQSQIPIASGLGSGAAVGAALGRALVAALDASLDDETLNGIVYEVEKIHHGTPSGIDNTVIVYEQPVYFVRGQKLETITIGRPFQLLIADSGQRALTRDSVGDVRKLFDAEPERIQPVLDQIGAIVAEVRVKIASGDVGGLGALMGDNHALLRELTVSSPTLDRLVNAAVDAGALGAKLSGGGRGGNIIALVTDTTRADVEKALLQAGATRVFPTTVR